mmetsp:Transcript_41990/g.130139  ORF Transcript_41990/g.130139 Transcript_41990/m.130139 type:complete len:212 (+) Transcript_41990:85-720(+)
MAVVPLLRQDRHRRHFPAALAGLLVVALAGSSLSRLLAGTTGWVRAPGPAHTPAGASQQAVSTGIGGTLAASCQRTLKRGLVASRVRHVALPDIKNIKSKQGAKEYKFDEDGGMYDIIQYPLLTEKACRLIEEFNTYTFMVDRRANKPQIRAAIETIFNVKVVKCNTYIPAARYKVMYGRKVGRKSVFKRAMCRLKEGDSIELFPDDPETP